MTMPVDFHSHILPGIDDGSDSVEKSLQMLRAAASQGVTRMVATPHFYAHNNTPEDFLEARRQAERQLQEAMGEETLPELVMGAEVYYFPGISDAGALQNLTVGDRCFVLVEMPSTPWTEDMYRELEQIELKQGLIPVIAHIDRYLTWFNRRSIMKKLSRLQVLIQANARFFRNKKTRRFALGMLRKGQIHLLGSDCHDIDHRKPDLDLAVEAIREKDPALLEQIFQWENEVFGR